MDFEKVDTSLIVDTYPIGEVMLAIDLVKRGPGWVSGDETLENRFVQLGG